MPGTVRSIILGGGIGAGSPATLGTFPIFSGATPPDELVDGNILQDGSTPPKVYIGTSTYDPLATVIGGAITTLVSGPGVVIGEGANIALTSGGTVANSVVIGYGAKDVSFTGNSVIIGRAADGTTANGGCVVIGAGAKGNRDSSVVIGQLAGAISAASNAIAIGYTASVTKNSGIAIGSASLVNGNNSIVIGPNASTNQNDTLTIGVGAINNVAGSCILMGFAGFSSIVGLTAGTVLIGGGTGVSTFIIGNGTTLNGTATNLTIKMTPMGGAANTVGGTMTLLPGLGTGNSVPSTINLDTPAVGASGSTVQTARTGVRVSASLVAGDTDLMVFDQNTLTLSRVSVGAANSGGAGFKLLCVPN